MKKCKICDGTLNDIGSIQCGAIHQEYQDKIKFYNNTYQVYLKTLQGEHWFDVDLKDFDGEPDCKIGSWKLNFWFRTNKGENGGEYKTEKTMLNAIKSRVKKLGGDLITFRSWEAQNA